MSSWTRLFFTIGYWLSQQNFLKLCGENCKLLFLKTLGSYGKKCGCPLIFPSVDFSTEIYSLFWFGLWGSEEDYYLGPCFPLSSYFLISHQIKEWNKL